MGTIEGDGRDNTALRLRMGIKVKKKKAWEKVNLSINTIKCRRGRALERAETVLIRSGLDAAPRLNERVPSNAKRSLGLVRTRVQPKISNRNSN